MCLFSIRVSWAAADLATESSDVRVASVTRQRCGILVPFPCATYLYRALVCFPYAFSLLLIMFVTQASGSQDKAAIAACVVRFYDFLVLERIAFYIFVVLLSILLLLLL